MIPERGRPAAGKAARLEKWNDEPSDFGDFDNAFGDENGDFLAQLDGAGAGLPSPVDEHATLRAPATGRGISPGICGNAVHGLLRGLARFEETGTDELSFGDAAAPRPLPGTVSAASPHGRRSLSEFSEDTDTDITEINDEDFEEIDDIFGKEESGIYGSDGGKRVAAKRAVGPGRAREVLSQRRQQMEQQARAEDDELCRRYHQRRERPAIPCDPAADEVTTIRLKDLRLRGALPLRPHGDRLQSDATVEYEYTKDDLETFEDGFVGDLPAMIRQDRLSHFNSVPAARTGQLLRKASMPVFPKSLRASGPTKFKSSMDLAGALAQKPSEHPLFNDNNRIIRKLDRMPSFHIKKERGPLLASHDDLLDYNMELRKKQLLEKYMEISEKQFQLRSSPKKASGKRLPDKPRKGVGVVRYLNQKSTAPSFSGNKLMTFNLDSKLWEGNDHDLLRFDEFKDEGTAPRKLKQPSLITVDQFCRQGDTIKGNMVYDSENLRWVNKDAFAEQQDNVFDDFPDLTPNDIPQYAPTEPLQLKHSRMNRGVSTFTRRTVLTNSHGSTIASNGTAGDEFILSAKLLAKFEKEELKIRKKTHHWFGPNESYHLSSRKPFDSEYFWEIRKMVIENDT